MDKRDRGTIAKVTRLKYSIGFNARTRNKPKRWGCYVLTLAVEDRPRGECDPRMHLLHPAQDEDSGQSRREQ